MIRASGISFRKKMRRAVASGVRTEIVIRIKKEIAGNTSIGGNTMPKRNAAKEMFVREVRRLIKKRVQQFCLPLDKQDLERAQYFVYGDRNSPQSGDGSGRYSVCCCVTGSHGDPGCIPDPLEFAGSVIYFDDADTDKDIGDEYDRLMAHFNEYRQSL